MVADLYGRYSSVGSEGEGVQEHRRPSGAEHQVGSDRRWGRREGHDGRDNDGWWVCGAVAASQAMEERTGKEVEDTKEEGV